MEVIIDRFEGEFAVVELPDRTMANLARVLVPGAKEGDTVEIKLCPGKAACRRHRVETLMKDVWND